MDFNNGATFEGAVDQDVTVVILVGPHAGKSLPKCRTFLLNGELFVDCIPALNRKHVRPVPDNSIVSAADAAEAALAGCAKLAIFVGHDSPLGQFVIEGYAVNDELGRRAQNN